MACKKYYKNMRGGKRKGAGRPAGSIKDGRKIMFSIRIAPDLLEKLRAHELPASQIIDRALRMWFERYS